MGDEDQQSNEPDREHFIQKLNSNQQEYNEIYDNLIDKRQYVEGEKKLHLVHNIDSAASILQRLVNGRRRTGMVRICEHLNSLNPFADMVNKQIALDKLSDIFDRKKRAALQDIRSAPYIF